jgi:hypothetical protein
MGSYYPQYLRALHLNLIAGSPPSLRSPIAFLIFLIMYFLKLYSDREVAGLEAASRYRDHGNAYFVVAKQRPNTIGIGLADSPALLLAWIYDKLVDWTDGYQWTEEEVCEWVSLYWFSRAGPAASVVIYHETSKGSWPMRPGIPAPGVKLVSPFLANDSEAMGCSVRANSSFSSGSLIFPQGDPPDPCIVEQTAGQGGF